MDEYIFPLIFGHNIVLENIRWIREYYIVLYLPAIKFVVWIKRKLNVFKM